MKGQQHVELPLPADEAWPHGKAFLVPSRGTLVQSSHPVTVNGKLARVGQTIEAGDVIAPAGSGSEARFVLQDLPGARWKPQDRDDWVRVFGTYLHAKLGDTIDLDLFEALTPEERAYFDDMLGLIVARRTGERR